MKYLFLGLVLISLTFISCQKQKDAEAIEMAFDSYKQSIKNQSDSASFYLDKESVTALTDFEEILKRGNQADKYNFIRKHNAPLTLQYLFSSLDIFGSMVYDSDKCNPDLTIKLFSLTTMYIFNADGIDNIEFDEIIEQNEYIATVNVIIKNRFKKENNNRRVNIKKKFIYRKEDGIWKLNAISYLSFFDKVIMYEAKAMGMSPDEYIKKLMKS